MSICQHSQPLSFTAFITCLMGVMHLTNTKIWCNSSKHPFFLLSFTDQNMQISISLQPTWHTFCTKHNISAGGHCVSAVGKMRNCGMRTVKCGMETVERCCGMVGKMQRLWMGVRCKLVVRCNCISLSCCEHPLCQAKLITVSTTHRSNIFYVRSLGLGTKFHRGKNHYFWRYPKFLLNTVYDKTSERKLPCKN